MSITTHRTIQHPHPKRWPALAVLMLPVLLVTVDNTVLSFALPKIAEALHPSASQQLWIIDAYSLVLAGLLISMGTLGDRVGHRKVLLFGSLGFTIISVLTAFSTGAPQLIAGRACMGIFGAMLMPSTLALIRSLFVDREERRLAVAVWACTLTVGSALGPLVGGVLLEFFDWGAIFLLAVPVLFPLLALGPWLLPESAHDSSGTIDPLSVLQSMVALTALVYSIKHIASEGIDSVALAAFGIGLLTGWTFVRRQLGLSSPLIDLTLFRNATFATSIAINLMSLALLIGFVFFATQFLQIILGIPPLRASLALVPGQVMAVAFGMLVVPIAKRVSAMVLVPILVACIAVAFLLVAGLGTSIAVLVVAFAVLNIGVGAIATVSNDIILSAAPPAKAGAASAISETGYEVGVVLGTTLLGGLLTASYRCMLALPDFLSPLQASLAGETLGGAGSVASMLPAGEALELMSVAASAFHSAIETMSWAAFAVALIALSTARYALKGQPTKN